MAKVLLNTATGLATTESFLLPYQCSWDSHFTFEAWIYQTSTAGTQTLLEHQRTSYPGGIDISYPNGFLYTWQTILGSTASATYTLEQNVWHHIAVSHESCTGDFTNLYVDGVEIPSTDNGVEFCPYEACTWVLLNKASTGNSTGFIGYVKKIRFSGVARYSTNFTPNYTYTADANTLFMYECNEGSGTKLTDLSSNGYDATLSGGISWADDPAPPATAMQFFGDEGMVA